LPWVPERSPLVVEQVDAPNGFDRPSLPPEVHRRDALDGSVEKPMAKEPDGIGLTKCPGTSSAPTGGKVVLHQWILASQTCARNTLCRASSWQDELKSMDAHRRTQGCGDYLKYALLYHGMTNLEQDVSWKVKLTEQKEHRVRPDETNETNELENQMRTCMT
jgi:hypothetical protein